MLRILLLLLALLGANASAQTYPSKPVRLIVTYPPGGSSDLMARVFGQKLSEVWGQQVIIESKPGAAGSIGMEYAARQPARTAPTTSAAQSSPTWRMSRGGSPRSFQGASASADPLPGRCSRRRGFC